MSQSVYSGLAAFADNRSQEAFPSIETLARKLHLGRSTVIRATQKLESIEIIEIKKELGKHNVYYLLDVPMITEKGPRPPDKPIATPGSIAADFFKGVADLRTKTESLQGSTVKNLLQSFAENYGTVHKGILWEEIKAFEQYWTELNKSGMKQRWESQPTFQVERRIVTWLSKKKEFARVGSAPKGAKVATL